MSELKAYIAPTADGTGLADYYLKSETDKVIAHHKFKRCLAMAGKCENGKLIYQYKQRCGDAETEIGLDYLMKRAGWYRKWQQRWLELAEKFKESK